MDTAQSLIVLFPICLIVFLFLLVESANNSKQKKQIKKMQNQINKLCRLTGNDEFASTYLSREERELILHLKSIGKTMEAIKKIRELRDLSLKKSCSF